ncbi:sulfatase-like hydrolase/transferase [Bacteriovoracaceae bacterium]|nr:sulfatase-like hydrolase/transferase [Bacteriovoracaceae bacterium]
MKEGVRKDKTREKFGKLLQGQNQSVLTFKNLGYQYIHFSNRFWKLSKCRFNYDICLPEIYTKEGLSGSLGSFYNHEFRNTFIGMTPLLGLINKVVSKNTLGDDVIPNNGIKYLNKWINDNVDNTKKPFFMFAHTFAVHQPYVYSKGCGVRKDADMKPPNNDIEAYLNEVSCMNNDILSLVETIEKRDPSAIIILQGDHGSETNLQLSKHPLSEWSDNDILERYSIFNAVKAPEECKNKFYNSMSPVNTLRGVLSCLSDKDLNNLEDQYYYAAYENMENFEVVEVVKRIKKLFLDK